MAGLKEWDNVNKANKAIGVIEGVAAGLRDDLEGLLIASCEVIDETLRDLMTQSGNDREEHQTDQTLIHTLLKDKDDLLTENSRLRDMLEKMATVESADEIATLDTPPNNDKIEGADGTSLSLCAAANQEKAEGFIDGCVVCKGLAKLYSWRAIDVWIKDRRLVVGANGLSESSTISFCPKCGRKL